MEMIIQLYSIMDTRKFTKKKTLQTNIVDLEKTPIDSDVLKQFGYKVIPYTTLNQYNTIEEVGECILFTPTNSQTNGHYSTLWIDVSGNLNYWCSYGYNLQKTLTFSSYMQHTSAPDEYYLMNLVNEFVNRTHKKFLVNEFKYQSSSPNIATCGRWSVVRLMHTEMSHQQFHEWFKLKGSLTDDMIVTLLTYLF